MQIVCNRWEVSLPGRMEAHRGAWTAIPKVSPFWPSTTWSMAVPMDSSTGL